MDTDFLLEEDDDYGDGQYFPEGFGEAEEDDDEEFVPDLDKPDKDIYGGVLSDTEVWFMSLYNEITKAGDIEEATALVVSANPQHTSQNTISYVMQDLFQKQGHNRMQNTKFNPDNILRGEDVAAELDEEDDASFNSIYQEESRAMTADFIDFLKNRDLSKDSIVNVRRKQRHIPAWIIYLFSSGMYDLIINCPTMPPEYDTQINNALRVITQNKYALVEELAARYEEKGRPKVADRVRQLQLAWFSKEPAEIKTSAEFRDLDLTQEEDRKSVV